MKRAEIIEQERYIDPLLVGHEIVQEQHDAVLMR